VRDHVATSKVKRLPSPVREGIPDRSGSTVSGALISALADGRDCTLLRQSTIGAAAASSIPASAIWRQASATFWLSS